jgi:hypothetical protein
LTPPIHGFDYGPVEPYSSISLLVTFDKVDLPPLKHVVFYVKDFDPTYDAIIGMSALHQH